MRSGVGHSRSPSDGFLGRGTLGLGLSLKLGLAGSNTACTKSKRNQPIGRARKRSKTRESDWEQLLDGDPVIHRPRTLCGLTLSSLTLTGLVLCLILRGAVRADYGAVQRAEARSRYFYG
ncbi:hypothetical protein BDV11DRAFT_183940 [Aspergillus similis]